jgi:hypothetical protein
MPVTQSAIVIIASWMLGLTAPAPPTPPQGDAPPAEDEAAPPEGDEGPPAQGDAAAPEGEDTPPAEAEQPAPKPSAPAPLVAPAEIARLQAEARSVRDELFKARARVSSVTAKLFRSKVTVELRSNLERFYEISEFTITLDGAPVYFKETGLAPVKTSIVEMYAAPGSHELGISAKLVAKRQKTYQMRVAQTFTVVVPEDSRLRTKFMVHELGNMFGKFDKRKRGAYRVHTELHAKAKANKKSKRKTAVTATGKASIGK